MKFGIRINMKAVCFDKEVNLETRYITCAKSTKWYFIWYKCKNNAELMNFAMGNCGLEEG